MPRPWRTKYGGAKYHITSRGNGGQQVFLTDGDRIRFLAQLTAALEKDGVLLFAYALMGTHYHLFLQTPRGNVDRFMQRLNTAYSMYFRYKHQRPGHCMQGRYKAKLVEGDDYIVRLTRYIHLNPVKTPAMKRMSVADRRAHLRRYCWSSYRGYVNGGEEEEIVDYRWRELAAGGPGQKNRSAYRRYVESMIDADDAILQESLDRSSYAIGETSFVEKVESEMRRNRQPGGMRPDLVVPEEPAPVRAEDVELAVAHEFGIQRESLRAHGRAVGIAKAVAVELCCQLSGCRQRDVGRRFGYRSDAGVTRQRRALRTRMGEDPGLAARVEAVRTRLSQVDKV